MTAIEEQLVVGLDREGDRIDVDIADIHAPPGGSVGPAVALLAAGLFIIFLSALWRESAETPVAAIGIAAGFEACWP